MSLLLEASAEPIEIEIFVSICAELVRPGVFIMFEAAFTSYDSLIPDFLVCKPDQQLCSSGLNRCHFYSHTEQWLVQYGLNVIILILAMDCNGSAQGSRIKFLLLDIKHVDNADVAFSPGSTPIQNQLAVLRASCVEFRYHC